LPSPLPSLGFSAQPGAGFRELIPGEEFDLSLPEPRARENQHFTFPFWVSDDGDLSDLLVILDELVKSQKTVAPAQAGAQNCLI